EEQETSLAPAAGFLEGLARLPEVDNAPHLLLRLGLAADVLELHAPVGVAGLEATNLADAQRQERAEEDHDVDQEEQRHDRDLRPERLGREDVLPEPREHVFRRPD